MRKVGESKGSSETLVKDALAERLRDEITSGRLRPGLRIVEGTWARKFGVALRPARCAGGVGRAACVGGKTRFLTPGTCHRCDAAGGEEEPVPGTAGRRFGIPSGTLPFIGEFLRVGTLAQDTPAIVCVCTNQGPGKWAEHVGVG